MEKIASFQVNHLTLEPGVYVSRVDHDPATGAATTTFDIRLTSPNREPVLNTAECHTLEHLGATYLRNHSTWASRIVYFGPMGCRTGCYLVVFGEVTSEEILPLVYGPGGSLGQRQEHADEVVRPLLRPAAGAGVFQRRTDGRD